MDAGIVAPKLVRLTGELLFLPWQAVASALTLLHKFRASSIAAELPDAGRLVAAVVFLAAKVEEATVRTNDMLNAVRQAQAILAAQEDPAGLRPPAAPRIDPIVGDEYYSLKTQLIVDEQLICRGTEFCLHMEHPHKWLFNYCSSLRCSCAVAKLACSILNDSLVYTTLCLLTQPEELAAAALHVASLLLGVARQMPHSGSSSWWTALGISLSTVETIGHQLLDMLTEHHQQSDYQTVVN